jgi:hypothetical protein
LVNDKSAIATVPTTQKPAIAGGCNRCVIINMETQLTMHCKGSGRVVNKVPAMGMGQINMGVALAVRSVNDMPAVGVHKRTRLMT